MPLRQPVCLASPGAPQMDEANQTMEAYGQATIDNAQASNVDPVPVPTDG